MSYLPFETLISHLPIHILKIKNVSNTSEDKLKEKFYGYEMTKVTIKINYIQWKAVLYYTQRITKSHLI